MHFRATVPAALFALFCGFSCVLPGGAEDEFLPLPAPDFTKQAKLDQTSTMAPLQGSVGSFDILVDEIQREFGFHCTEGSGGLLVEGLKPGSAAYDAGLRNGDLIANASRSSTEFKLTVNRNGSKSMITLTPKFGNLSAQTRISRFQLKAEQSAPKQNPVFVTSISKKLAEYNLELIIDRSMSMRKRDCPGYYSRWGWCGMQAEQLGQQIAATTRQGITITTFASDYIVYENQSADQIANVFNNSQLQLGTRMGEPLEARINRALQNRSKTGKPTLIAVITDGVPHPRYEPGFVTQVIVNASNRMRNPQDVTVLFFQVGAQDFRGQRFLQHLDNGLQRYGARYDIVQTVPFEYLQRVGLAQAMVDSLNNFRKTSLR